MDQNMALFLVGQSAVIVGAVATSYVRTRIALAKLEVRGENVEYRIIDLKTEHALLSKKVDGVSRAVSRIQGRDGINVMESTG